MKLNILPFSSGLQWWIQALLLFKQKPSIFFGMGCFCFLFTFMVLLFPVVGALLYGVTYVLSSLLFMLCVDAFIHKKIPAPAYFVESIVKNPNRVLARTIVLGLLLSLLFAFAGFFAIIILRILNPQGVQIMLMMASTGAQNINEIPPEIVEILARTFIWTFVIASLQSLLILMLFLFTPAFVYWHKTSAIKAIFFNGITLIKNFKPLLCYFLLLCIFAIACTIILVVIKSVLVTLLADSSLSLVIQSLIMFMTSISFFAIFQISIYIAFKSCFTSSAH